MNRLDLGESTGNLKALRMRETTTFLCGAAIAGLAVLVFMRGGVNSQQAPTLAPLNSPAPTSSPIAVPAPTPTLTTTPLPMPTVAAPDYFYEQQNQVQKQAIVQLQTALEQQKAETDKLKEYVQRQQLELEVLKAQAKATAEPSQTQPSALQSTATANRESPPHPLLLGMFWALGGVVLSFGGAMVLITMFAWFARQQQRNARMHEYYSNRNYPRIQPARGYYVQTVAAPRRARQVEAED